MDSINGGATQRRNLNKEVNLFKTVAMGSIREERINLQSSRISTLGEIANKGKRIITPPSTHSISINNVIYERNCPPNKSRASMEGHSRKEVKEYLAIYE